MDALISNVLMLALSSRVGVKPRVLPAATGAALVAYGAINAGAMGTPALAGAVGAGIGCVYLGIPQTNLVDEGPLVVGCALHRSCCLACMATPAIWWAIWERLSTVTSCCA
eukprot:COSAG01_NODE_1945_length_8831_cov_4.250000_13_plen_111_part_00